MNGSSTALDILAQGEAFTRVFVQPLVEAVRTEMQTHVAEVKHALDTVNGFEGRVSKLESNQKKALVGWGVAATAATGLFTAGIGWIKRKLHLG